MAITFNNVVYPAGYFSQASQRAANGFQIDSLSPFDIIVSGSVSDPGDTVSVTIAADGTPLQTFTATSFDDNESIVFTGQDGNSYILSSVPLSLGEIIIFNETNLGDYAPLCFADGTAIRIIRDGIEADIPVEGLRVGDTAVTASGEHRPITWIGQRRLGGDRQPAAEHAPVRVRAGAFGHGLPVRDLCLSPGHPVLVGADADNEGGVLVPVMCLINGTSIARTDLATVTYWHVELDVHDILLAEGLPAESYIDLGTRSWFTGADGTLVDPDFVAPGMPGRCRPVAVDGPIVEAERARLAAVFAGTLNAACAWDDTAAWTAA
ncbi:MAG: Hint domain-containing protein [Methylorubrum populi]